MHTAEDEDAQTDGKPTWTTLMTVFSHWEACNWLVSMGFPLSPYYKVTDAEVFEPCFYLTENDLNSWAKGRVCSKKQMVCTDENKSISQVHSAHSKHDCVTV